MLWHGKNFRGIINKAKEMIFDNTGTNLISTNAEDAIKEINSNLTDLINGESVTVTGDGVKTYHQLLDSLYALIDWSKVNYRTKLYINYGILPLATNLNRFVGFNSATTTIQVEIRSLNSEVLVNQLPNNITDVSNIIYANGVNMTLYYY